MLRWSPQMTLRAGLGDGRVVRPLRVRGGGRVRPPVTGSSSSVRRVLPADRTARLWLFVGLLVAVYLVVRTIPVLDAWDREEGPGFERFTDFITYLAAGERLNAGHDLYRLVPGDREVLILADTFTAPFVSPPPIAALWRPIAAVPFGQAAWIAACWIVLLGTVVYLIAAARWVGLGLSLVLAPAIVDQLAVANVAAFFPALLLLAWRRGDGGATGIALGLMAVIKLSPVAMVGWLVGTRAWQAVRAWAVTLAALLVVGVIGAGVQSYLDYLDVARSTHPSLWSVSALTGIPWLSYAVLAGGTILSAAVGRRPALSFMIAVGASVFGSPALYAPGMVALLALGGPFVGVAVTGTNPVATARAYADAAWRLSPT